MNGYKTNGYKTNGHAVSKSQPKVGDQAWKALGLGLLPKRDPDTDYWFQLTGRQLVALMDAAGYPLDKQYEALLLHYHHTSPHMGPSPRSTGMPVHWKSLLQLDGTPLEYSWKWNTATGEPDMRYLLEPIGKNAGTELDPLNQQSCREVLHSLAQILPGADLTWSNHFFNTLFDHDNAKYMEEVAAGGPRITGSAQISLEFLRDATGMKSYFLGRKLGQRSGFMPAAQWQAAMDQLDPGNVALAALQEFMEASPEGRLMTPFCLSVDNIDPSKSRLKWYFNQPRTTFAAVRDIMTLGGRIPMTAQLLNQLDELWQLIRSVAGLPDDFPEDQELPFVPPCDLPSQGAENGVYAEMQTMLKGFVYFFDIAPGRSLPGIKIYFPVRNHQVDDRSIMMGLKNWMEPRGRAQYCDKFLEALEVMADHRGLETGQGMQTFVSCQFKPDGDLDLTSYLNPEGFHSARMNRQRQRATRRRGDF